MAFNFSNRYRNVSGGGLPDHIYVDGGCATRTGGSDSDSGGINDPVLTLTYAKTIVPLNGTIVLAPSEYQNQLGSNSGYESITFTLVADTMNNDCILLDTIGDKFGVSGENVENITFENYATPMQITTSGVVKNVIFLNCTEVIISSAGQHEEIDFINTNFRDTSGSNVQLTTSNCAFYGSNIINDTFASAGTRMHVFERCYFDENSSYIYADDGGTNFVIDDSHIQDSATFGIIPTELTINPNTTEEVNNPAMFLSPSFFDKSVAVNSPLLRQIGANVGNVFRGISASPDIPGFVAAVLANPDIDIVGSEIVLDPSVPVGESRTVEGFSLVATGISRLTKPFQIGISIKCEYGFEVRVADPGIDINTQPWRKFRFGEEMTENADGTTTGEDTYDWTDNNPINYKTAEGRLVLTQV